MKRIARVFPRRIESATPIDADVFVGHPGLFAGDYDEVHVSVTFIADRQEGERLARAWRSRGTVTIGGPAFDDFGGDFVPGRYLKPGYVITSRGCPNNCWYCHAWKREGRQIRELPIEDGWNVLDNNLLACSVMHQEAVFAMLARQTNRPRFTGGFEASRFDERHALWMKRLKPEVFYFAFDREGDDEYIHEAVGLLAPALLRSHRVKCYVLCAYPGDTIRAALQRCETVAGMGVVPMAMLYEMGSKVTAGTLREWKDAMAVWIQITRAGAATSAMMRKGAE